MTLKAIASIILVNSVLGLQKSLSYLNKYLTLQVLGKRAYISLVFFFIVIIYYTITLYYSDPMFSP